MSKVYQYYKDLPPWAKGVVIVGGLAVTYFAVRGVWNKIKKDADLSKARKTQKETDSELKALERSGVSRKYASSQYLAWADAIQNQFDGCDPTSNYYSTSLPFASSSFVKVANIVKQLKNDADFLALVSAFGIRSYDQCGPSFLTGTFGPGDLYAAISDELGLNEIKELNKLLAKQGIKYQF